MLWIFILALGIGAVALASSRPVTEEDVRAVANHMLIAERDPNVVLNFQHVLSAAGRFELAQMMADRWQSLTSEISREIETVNQPAAPEGGPIITATQPAPVHGVKATRIRF